MARKDSKGARMRGKWGGSDHQKTLLIMEGALSEIMKMEKARKPAKLTHVFLAGRFGVSSTTMRKRLQDAIAKQARNDDAALFVELWNRISDELGHGIMTTISSIAQDPEHNKAFDAARWMLERINAETVAIEAASIDKREGLQIADVDPEVWDELDPTEEMLIAEIEANIHGEMHKLERIVRRAQKRLADRRASDTDEDED